MCVARATAQREVRLLAEAAAHEQGRLRDHLGAAYRALESEAERKRVSAREVKELRARASAFRRRAARAVCAALLEARAVRAFALRTALGRWADAARFLEPALGSSAAHLARLHARLHELQGGLADAREAVHATRAQLAQQHGAALASHALVAQGERLIRQSEGERQALADELRASELRAAALEVQLGAAEATLASRERARAPASLLAPRATGEHALRDATNQQASQAGETAPLAALPAWTAGK